jgi:hypothetical protein
MGVPDATIKPLQRLQNMCAKMVLGLNKFDSATEALYSLHWLPIRARIEFKTICICHQCIHGNAPEYLKCLLQKVTVIRSLHNSLNREFDLNIPFNRRKTFADRSTGTFGPKTWNVLPYELKSQSDFVKFKRQCKTYLFNKYFY